MVRIIPTVVKKLNPECWWFLACQISTFDQINVLALVGRFMENYTCMFTEHAEKV